MKIGQFDLSAWTYRGTRMDPAASIARRAAAMPIVWVGKAIVFAGAWLGWGIDEAKDAWERLS